MAKVTCRHFEFPLFSVIPAEFSDDAAYIWVITISSSLHLADNWRHILSPDEVLRASRYHHDRDSKRFVVSRIALRVILSKLLAQPAHEIVFSVADNKKPFINGSQLHYNMTHAGDKILIAVARHEVGIDIEKIDYGFDGTDVLTTCFSTAAQDFIAASEDPQATFYKFWTRKEAIQKASGRGIDDDIVNVPCLDGTYIRPGKVDICVSSFLLPDSYVGSIATTNGPGQLLALDGDKYLVEL